MDFNSDVSISPKDAVFLNDVQIILEAFQIKFMNT